MSVPSYLTAWPVALRGSSRTSISLINGEKSQSSKPCQERWAALSLFMEINRKTQPIRSVLFRATFPPLFIWLNNDMAWYPNPLWQINVMFGLCQLQEPLDCWRKVTRTPRSLTESRLYGQTGRDSQEVLMKAKCWIRHLVFITDNRVNSE